MQSLSILASKFVQQLLGTVTVQPAAVTCVTENLVVHLKNQDAFVFNVLGSPIIQAGPASVVLPVTTASSGASTTVTMTNTTGLVAGMFVFGAGITSGTVIISVSAGASIVISIAAVTTLNQNLTFAQGLPYFDGSSYRDDVPASFAGAPDKVMGSAGAGVSASVSLSTFISTSDRINKTPPKPTPKVRNQVVFYRYDQAGFPLGIRWFWADLVLGIGDAPRQYPS